MTIDEYDAKRYEIVFAALTNGLRLRYKLDWEVFLSKGDIYQSYKNPSNGNEITHKSGITLSEFMKFIQSLDLQALKRMFGDTRLIQLQNRLIEEGENG